MPVRRLHISDTLSLPLEGVTQTYAILGKRGVGKSTTAFVMAEEMIEAGLHICFMDLLGVAWGLRSSADGKRAGLPVHIIGGERGDLPLNADSGTLIADLVTDQNINAILDLSLLRKGEQDRFATAFAEQLYRKNRKPLHLFVDEADAMMPQRPMPDQRRMLGAFEDLVRRGRARGIGLTMITQRSAVINKNTLSQAEVLIALRTIAPQDREAIDAWIEAHGTKAQRDAMMADLASLPIGTAYFWSPGWLDVFKKIRIARRKTFDSSATPKVGDRTVPPKVLAPVEIEKLKTKLAVVIEQHKQADPRELRKRIAELERAVREKPQAAAAVPVKAAAKVEVREVPVLRASQIARFEKAVSKLQKSSEKLFTEAAELKASVARFESKGRPVTLPVPARPMQVIAPIPRAPRQAVAASQNGDLRAGERRMLQTLAQRPTLLLTRAQLGTLAGFTASGGTFGQYFATLKRLGFLVEENGSIQITDSGLGELGGAFPAAPRTEAELLALWNKQLRAGENKILDIVLANPGGIAKDALSEQTYRGGTFGQYLGTLRRNGLVAIEGDLVLPGEALALV